MNLHVVLISILALLAACPLAAQRPCEEVHLPFDPPFSCVPRRIDAASGGSILAQCSEEIRLCVGKPLPQRDPAGVRSAPVRLYRIDGDPAFEPAFLEHAVHWYPDTATGSIVVIPDPPLAVTEGTPSTPVLYRLVTDCRYWSGTQTEVADTSFLDLWKQHVIRVQGAARRLHDRAEITQDVVIIPSPQVATHNVASGLDLLAEDTDRYVFDHWACNEGDVPVRPDAAVQHLRDVCWPLTDTVRFTAWYRDRTSTTGGGSKPTDVHVQYRDGHLVITSNATVTSVAVTDVRGALHLWRDLPNGMSSTDISFAAPPGLYVVVVRCGRAATITPLILSP